MSCVERLLRGGCEKSANALRQTVPEMCPKSTHCAGAGAVTVHDSREMPERTIKLFGLKTELNYPCLRRKLTLQFTVTATGPVKDKAPSTGFGRSKRKQKVAFSF